MRSRASGEHPVFCFSFGADVAAGTGRDSLMDRRVFLGGLACAALAACHEHPPKIRRIGVLEEGPQAMDPYFWVLMKEYGWIEDQNVVLVPRYSGKQEQLSDLAAELVRLKVDLIIAVGSPASSAAKRATDSIPVLFIVGRDPVESGLVSSLARPGANITGFTQGYYTPKMLEILKLTLPLAKRVALPALGLSPVLADAAKALDVEVSLAPIQSSEDIAAFFSTMRKSGIDAVLIALDLPVWLEAHYPLIAAEAAKNQMPCIAWRRRFPELGGLMSYGPIPQHWRSVVPQIDKIFKGAKPADLPVELAKKFELVVNVRAANALGIKIPQSIMVRVDEAIR